MHCQNAQIETQFLQKRNKNLIKKKERLYQTSQDDWEPTFCVYESKKDHKSSKCKRITKLEDRKKF